MAEQLHIIATRHLIEACDHDRLGIIAICIVCLDLAAPRIIVRNVALDDTPELREQIDRARAAGGNPVASLN